MEQVEAALCCWSQYQFLLGHTIPKIPYFSITSVDMPNNPSAVAAQPRHQPGHKVVMFFMTHTSIGRVSNFILEVQAKSDPFGT
jgi:hypothetical protein